MASQPITIEVNGTIHEVTVEPDPSSPECLRVSWGEIVRLVDARRVDKHTLSLVGVGDGEPRSVEACVVGSSTRGTLDVTIDGVTFQAAVDMGQTFLGGASGQSSQGPHDVLAPMPGKVVRVLVKEGDAVDAKQRVVVVEAMKMENELSTPRAGIVKRVLVSEGVSVDAGTVLVVIE